MAKKVTVIPAIKKNHSVNSTVDATSKIRVAAYCRVSTDHEEQESSFKNQQEYYSKYIQNHPEYTLAGIYADEGITATNTKKREQFKKMIKDCEDGKIDMIITKSISRFARNTQDCLHYSRKLKELRIPIVFEKENINTMDASGELLFTILSSLAQEESRNISDNCKWAIKHNFEKGKPSINTTLFMGYDKDEDGKLVINPEQAKIVKKIFQMFIEGYTCSMISASLRAEGAKGCKTSSWANAVIRNMLQNEKYCGDILMQKTYTEDFLTKKKVKNNGELEQYFIADAHEAIIPKDIWNAVQLELKRRYAYCDEIGVRVYNNVASPFSEHVICECGRMMRHIKRARDGAIFWRCASKRKGAREGCGGDDVFMTSIEAVFRIAWNSIVEHADEYTLIWDKKIAEGNPLERLRANQMKTMVTGGPIDMIVPEHVRLVLERIVVYNKQTFEVRFLDGTIKTICLPIE